MAKALVFCESGNGKLKKGAIELLQFAQRSGFEITAVAVGPEAKQVTDEMGQQGAQKAIVCADASLEKYNPENHTAALAKIITEEAPELIFASSSVLARDLFPRIAARLDCGSVSDCTEIEWTGSELKVRRPMYAGKCSVGVEFLASTPKIVLMRPNQLPVGDAPGGSAEVVEATHSAGDLKTLIKEIVKGASEKLDLTEANVIVSGGRGLQNAENFKILEELADVLGATVGASRAVCDAGWVPHSMQVGQTGKTVAPSLYIACGISGAIQHLAGMTGSKVIVAINKDPEAPIFQKSTYGIVGDVFEVVPKLTEEFRQLLS